MLERTPFLQFLAPRIARTQTRLGAKIWQVDEKPLAVSQSTPTHEHRRSCSV